MSSVRATIFAQVSSLVLQRANDLDERHHRHGLKKCMPMTRPGIFEVEAMRVTEIDEVLVARMASCLQTRSRSSITAFLMSKRSSTASTTTSHASEVVDLSCGGDAGERRVPVLGLEIAAADLPLETLLDCAHAAGERCLPDVPEPDRIACRSEGLGHARAHCAGPDHADFFDALDHVLAPYVD